MPWELAGKEAVPLCARIFLSGLRSRFAVHALPCGTPPPLYRPSVPQFKLRDVVDYVADVLAHNAASSAAAARLAPAADAIAARLKGARCYF